jgi:hypothetical protein
MTMMEASYLIELDIRHYRELLNRDSLTEAQRSQVMKLLADAQMKLLLAVEEESERGREGGLCAD